MTQQEFDAAMAGINEAREQEITPILQEIDEVYKQKREISIEIQHLKLKLDELELKTRDLYIKRREINRGYHELKHQLIIQNPKSSME